jgi:hypothetical protein
MTQAQVVHEFAADPASVALLLAGPAANALWPQGDAGAVEVSVGPPMRSGVGFVVDLTVTEPGVGSVRGRLSLVPCRGQASVGGTSARLVLSGVHAPVAVLRDRADGFLESLSEVAVARSSAA